MVVYSVPVENQKLPKLKQTGKKVTGGIQLLGGELKVGGGGGRVGSAPVLVIGV